MTIHRKRFNLPQNVRATAMEILCSFSKMLTSREKIVLHWLAEGFPVGEIASRLRMTHRSAIETSHRIPGGARSLPLDSPSASGGEQKKNPQLPAFRAASRSRSAPQP